MVTYRGWLWPVRIVDVRVSRRHNADEPPAGLQGALTRLIDDGVAERLPKQLELPFDEK